MTSGLLPGDGELHFGSVTVPAGRVLPTIPEIAPALISAPFWSFWWD